ncbi:phage tail family protein [Streptococcus parauberis]|uniref:Phage capsid protein n=1 Tax=Streptococcus parauberis KRS-02083 TaxID=1207545 RepID=A0ABN0IS89_9STRE|nr:distal tail protein Dit [Streptococcus parauberis]EMG25783.1 Phage capsid protein [Streptococcus parauberis KRS-02083]QBX27506.1 capsid and scaffold protein [Streptococcus phage Javan392]WEM64300.1 phage tail family protein [Streptococcus parauberis]WOF46130.1 phage tail family protein [Streptococcus parauberis]
MTIPVSFNNHELHKIVDDIILQPRQIGSSYNNQYLEQGSNRHGQIFLYNTEGIKQIPFEVSIKGNHQHIIDVGNKIDKIMKVKKPCPLIFGDEPNKIWRALPTGQFTYTADYSTSPPTAKGTLVFDIPSGRAESKDYLKLGTESPSSINGKVDKIGNMYHVEINNNCSSEMSPIFTFTHKTENGYIGIFSDNDEYFTIGNKEEKDTTLVKKSEILLDYRDSKITNGLSSGSKGVAILNDTSQTQNGTLGIKSAYDKKQLYLVNAGGTVGNNAGSLSWDIPADSNGEVGSLNDYIYWQQIFQSFNKNQKGFIKVTVSDSDGHFLYGVETIKRSLGTVSEYNFMATDGKGGYQIIDSKSFTASKEDNQNPFNYHRGFSDILRRDDFIQFFYWGSYQKYNIPDLKGKKSAKVHVSFSAFGTSSIPTDMYINSIYYRKDFVNSEIDIPNRYPDGSVVKIDMENGKVTVNGANANDQHLDNSEFYTIDTGKHTADIYFSSWIEQLPELLVEWKEKY